MKQVDTQVGGERARMLSALIEDAQEMIGRAGRKVEKKRAG